MSARHSYRTWITALITFDVLLLTTSAPYSEDLPEFIESRQLRRNLANSKFKNHIDWLKNYTLKPLEQDDSTKPPPVWEREIKLQSNEEENKKDEWDEEMQELTKKRLEKWKNVEENSEEKMKNLTYVDKNESSVKGEVNLSEIDFSSNTLAKDKKVKGGSGGGVGVGGAGKYSTEARRTLSKKLDFEKFDNSSSKSETSQANGLTQDERIEYQSGRWGMSMKNPPVDFLMAISRADDGDESKFKDREGVGVGKNFKINRGEAEEGGKYESKEEEEEEIVNKDKKLFEPANNFSSDRWGMSVSSPPEQFLREISSNRFLPMSIDNSGFGLSAPQITSGPTEAARVLTNELADNSKKDARLRRAYNRTDNLTLELRNTRTRTLSPIFIIGPSFWTLKLPINLKQRLGIIPNELAEPPEEERDNKTEKETETSPLRNIHLTNTKIIIGQTRVAKPSDPDNYENEDQDNYHN
ncbi:uncharacterized protein LOC130675452 [Microplitis mediator]|uniref:uncharacterized protein LOC130675452 n=1 Tax=Microplitis mediator TaxID=375433 RepID=UPI00255715D7|nr:uncharacterized protein LOC130675452 [Microplitis mediator]